MIWGQANSPGMPPNKKVNKSDKITYPSISIGIFDPNCVTILASVDLQDIAQKS
jgi:hypothetical protein